MDTQQITAYLFGRSYGNKLSFGMNREDTAAVLRTLADRIEDRSIVLQTGTITTEAKADDYTRSILVMQMEYVERLQTLEDQPALPSAG